MVTVFLPMFSEDARETVDCECEWKFSFRCSRRRADDQRPLLAGRAGRPLRARGLPVA